MPGEYFSNIYNNQPYSSGYANAQPYAGGYEYMNLPPQPISGGYEYTSVLPQSYNYGYQQPYNYGYSQDTQQNYYVGQNNQLFESNNSPDESIRLVQRRKSNCMPLFFSCSFIFYKNIFILKIALKDKVNVGAPKTASQSTKIAESAAQVVDEKVVVADGNEKASNKSGASLEAKAAEKEEKKLKSDAKKTKKQRKVKREVYAEDAYYVPGGPVTQQYTSGAYDPYQVQYSYQPYTTAPAAGPAESYFDSYANYDAGYGDYYGQNAIVEPLVTIGPRTDIDYQKTASVQVKQNVVYSAVEVQQQPLAQPEPIVIEGSGLPPGSKIIAEYILGYLENEPEKHAATYVILN